MIVSVIIPVYNEGEHIRSNVEAIAAACACEDTVFEFVLVDDGSRDDSFAQMELAAERLPCARLLSLSRNFGKEAALSAGLSVASGEACIVMDSDLQHPPELIPQMIRLWREQGYEVVECVKEHRGREGRAYRLFARLFYSAFHKLGGFDLQGASDFKLMDRKVVDAWKTMTEHATFFRGMSAWVGFKRTSIPFRVPERAGGESKWSFRRLVGLAVGAITSFSALPLQLVTVAGVIFLICAVVLSVQTLVMKVLGHAAGGFTTVILLLLIIGSLIMISLGIIGTYIARIYDEVKCRPRYIVSREVNMLRGERR